LRLADFYHLPELDTIIARLIADGPGLVVVAGLDPRPAASDASAVIPSGRGSIFRILLGDLLDAHPRARAAVVAHEREAVRVSRTHQRRVSFFDVQRPEGYADVVATALRRAPELLVVDRLGPANVASALGAAANGTRVFAQLDTIFRGASVGRHLLDLGAPSELLGALAWVIAVQRLPMVCQSCRRSAEQTAHAALLGRFATDVDLTGATFFHPVGCVACGGRGRAGDIAAFDIVRAAERLIGLEEYALRLAMHGHVALDDVADLHEDQLRRTYRLLTASEQALTRTNAKLERKVVELEAANRVLQQRTAAVMSLQDIGSALTSSAGLPELVGRVTRHARDLCGADRAILYLRHGTDEAEVLAVSGWDTALLHACLPAKAVFGAGETAPAPFAGYPPGIPEQHPDREGGVLRAGMRVPLVAQQQLVGLMIVHTTLKPRFTQAEAALLRTFANQAALSIQRERLVEQLRAKVAALEAAQDGLAAKERLEREMELAREVQQSVLPQVFPAARGLAFAARNEPARQVGGDFYDVFRLDERRVGLVVADVSGKGMPAALYMALSRSLLLAEARREPSPRAALLNVNRLLRELGEPHMFVTVFYGVLDEPTRRLTYCRAGHDYPLLLRNGGAHLLDAEGTVLGFFAERELRLDEATLDLLPGDRLALYTDGMTDALSPTGRRFELPRLTDLLASLAHHPALTLLDATFDALRRYQGTTEQYDDMTMLVVEVNGHHA
jgi:serine phosphatase RsbU (regulator of sigma subunit)